MPILPPAIRTRIRAAFFSLLLNPWSTRIVDSWFRRQSLGKQGELLAERFLLKHGLVIVARSFVGLSGEIDLIAVDERTVVFVEVKTRISDAAGDPAEAVDQAKQEKICSTAIYYLKKNGLLDCRCRFDVISIVGQPGDPRPAIKHFRDAFEFTSA